MTIWDIESYLGPKPAIHCYAAIYNLIVDCKVSEVSEVKLILKKIIGRKLVKSFCRYIANNPEAWVEQAKEIYEFIESNE